MVRNWQNWSKIDHIGQYLVWLAENAVTEAVGAV
jgi:hypothetical protein